MAESLDAWIMLEIQGAGGQLCHCPNFTYLQGLGFQNVTWKERGRKHPTRSLSLPEISSASFFMLSSVATVTAAVKAEFHSIPSSILSSDSAIWVMLPARKPPSALSDSLNTCFASQPLSPLQALFHSLGQVCAWLLPTKPV